MTGPEPHTDADPGRPQQLTQAWRQQRLWSETANLLKANIDTNRWRVLLLGIAAAVLAVASTQLSGPWEVGGRILSAAAAIASGITVILQRRVGTDQIRNWTRARSASEALKSEIYGYLAGGSNYTGADRDVRLEREVQDILTAVEDLQRHTVGVTADRKPPPAVHDVDSYAALRVEDQIRNYYRRRATTYEGRVRRLRRVADLLGGLTVILAAIAAAFETTALAAWVPVVTTISTSVIAYMAAARLDHQVVEFLRTAQQLERLCQDRLLSPGTDPAAFVDECERVISIENEGWMARWEPDSA